MKSAKVTFVVVAESSCFSIRESSVLINSFRLLVEAGVFDFFRGTSRIRSCSTLFARGMTPKKSGRPFRKRPNRLSPATNLSTRYEVQSRTLAKQLKTLRRFQQVVRHCLFSAITDRLLNLLLLHWRRVSCRSKPPTHATKHFQQLRISPRVPALPAPRFPPASR